MTTAAATIDKGYRSYSAAGKPLSRETVHGWIIKDQPGEFQWINKNLLYIDKQYQRGLSNAKTANIRSAWSWAAFGVLCVARRPDGTYWVFDGQHRKSAADDLASIVMLPCMVFEMDGDVSAEAGNFLTINTARGAVRTIDKWQALIIAKDRDAVAVNALLEERGYRVCRNTSPSKNEIKCVGALMKMHRADAMSLRTALDTAITACDGHVIENILTGLWRVQKHLRDKNTGESIADAKNINKLAEAGHLGIKREINKAIEFYGGGEMTYGRGVLRILNRGRSTRRLPDFSGNESI